MPEKRILQLVGSCGECPRYQYYSGGTSKCIEVDQIVRDKHVVAPFCPLAPYPADIIADQAETIRVMREGNDTLFVFLLLERIGKKLNAIRKDGTMVLEIPLKEEGKTVCLDLHYVDEERSRLFPRPEIRFKYQDSWYILDIEAKPPILKKVVRHPGGSEAGELYESVPLAV